MSQVTIFLVGARAAGKTTAGRRLALELGLEFVDADHALEEKYGRTVADIVEHEGWEEFRRLESGLLREVTAGGPQVVATGGGVVLAEANRGYLRERGLVFYLAAPAETLAARLAADPQTGRRPSLTGQPAAEEFVPVLTAREALYRETAHHVIDATAPVETVAAEILAHLRAVGR